MSMTFGVTPEGYVLKPQSEINSEIETDAANVVDPVTNESLQLDFNNPEDILALLLAIVAEGIGDGLLVDQAAYNQFNPNGATGDALSTLVLINGIRRKGATSSVVFLDFTGTPLVTIPSTEGVRVTDVNNTNIWLVTEDIVFDVTGNATSVEAVCQTLGSITALAASLITLVADVSGIDTVTNPSSALPGEDEENDAELRQRRDKSTETPAIGTPGGIFSALQDLEGVETVRVYNNIFITTDSNGIPPKSLAVVIVGGDDDAIADILLARNNTGSFFGTTTIIKVDIQGVPIAINFTRPAQIPIYVIVDITVTDESMFPANGEELIKENIVLYAQSGAQAIGVTDGFNDTGFTPGSDIIHSRLYTPVNSVPGHTVDDLFIGFASSPTGTADLPIAFDEVGEFLTVNIIVNVTVPPVP